jgi:hypothetical protein
MYTETKVRMLVNFSSETIPARQHQINKFKVIGKINMIFSLLLGSTKKWTNELNRAFSKEVQTTKKTQEEKP